MKAILEFNLPEDEAAHKLACNAQSWQSVVQELDTHMRNEIKYNSQASEADTIIWQKTRDKLHELLREFDLNIY